MAEQKEKKLTPKERLFCENYVYITQRNGTEAATLAGYGNTKESAATIASRLLKKPTVLAYISELDRQLYEAIGISPELIAVRMERLYQNSVRTKRDNMTLKVLREMKGVLVSGQSGKKMDLNITLNVVGAGEETDGTQA